MNFLAPQEPGLVRVGVNVCQGDIERSAEALVTVTHELLPQVGTTTLDSQGLPGYTFERAPGESWRSKFDSARNIIIVNSGHRDFVYAAPQQIAQAPLPDSTVFKGVGTEELRRFAG